MQVTRTFGADVRRLTAIEIVFSVGMIAGGGLIAAWDGFANRIHTMMVSHALIAVCTLALGLAPIFWLCLLAMGLFGVGMPFFNTPATLHVRHAARHVAVRPLGRANPHRMDPGRQVIQVSAGDNHTCAIKPDGTLACWGDGVYDQTTPPSGTFLQVSAGGGHTCAVKADGTVTCWGSTYYGESTPPAAD